MGQAFQSDLAFEQQMWPHQAAIYRRMFPGCTPVNLRQHQGKESVHPLDKERAIDVRLEFPDGTTFTMQQKVRRNEFLSRRCYKALPDWPDFTQEYMNGVGTPYESPGEWFHLESQYYFYGWTDLHESSIPVWVILDVAQYKRLVQSTPPDGQRDDLPS
jgi:hypothetical protein